MLFYKMTYTSEMKETERQDDTRVAKCMNNKLKTPPPQSTVLQVFKELVCVSGSSLVQQNDRSRLFLQEPNPLCRSPGPLCPSPLPFHDKEHCHLPLMSRLPITSRAENGDGVDKAHGIKHFKRLLRVSGWFGGEFVIQSMMPINL